MNLSKLFGKKTFPRGIHLEEYKEETNAKPTRRLPFAPEIIVPLAQHVGKPSLFAITEINSARMQHRPSRNELQG